jgi:membrane protease YdiL (CAAX protease family)
MVAPLLMAAARNPQTTGGFMTVGLFIFGVLVFAVPLIHESMPYADKSEPLWKRAFDPRENPTYYIAYVLGLLIMIGSYKSGQKSAQVVQGLVQ